MQADVNLSSSQMGVCSSALSWKDPVLDDITDITPFLGSTDGFGSTLGHVDYNVSIHEYLGNLEPETNLTTDAVAMNPLPMSFNVELVAPPK